MINVTFKDSKSTKYEKGTSIEQIVSTLGHRLQKEALAASLNGKTVDLTKEIMQDSNLEILTFDDEGGGKHLDIQHHIYLHKPLKDCSPM